MKPIFAVMLSQALPAKELAARAENDLKINLHTLRAYRSGSRVPTDEVAEQIAAVVFSDPAQRQKFLEEVRNAGPQRSQLENLSEHNIRLKVSTIAYSSVSQLLMQPDGGPPLSKAEATLTGGNLEPGKSGFVDIFFLRFLRLSGIKWESQKRNFSADVREQLWSGAIDVALSYFTTIERALLVRFWPLPIRLTLGALCHTEFRYAGKRNQVLDALDYHTMGPNLEVVPIVLRGSASHLHCRATLGYKDGETMRSVHARDFKLYDKTYKEVWKEFPGKVPVLVDDELSLAEMLGAVGPDRELLFPDYFPILPVTSELSAREDIVKRESPIYFVSVACSRRNDNLWSFLDDALRSLLLTEIYTTSEAYVSLYFNLLEIWKKAANHFLRESGSPAPSESETVEFGAAAFSLAHQWVMYTLHLTQFGISQFTEAYPHWKSILMQSRSLIFERLADAANRDEITYLIQSLKTGHRAGGKDIGQTLLQLEQVLDLHLHLDATARKYAALAPGALYQIVTERLKGFTGPNRVQINVVMYDNTRPLEGVVLVGVKALLEKATEAIGSGSGVPDGIETFVHWDAEYPNALVSKEGVRAFVAMWPESGPFPDPAKRVLGVALVVPSKSNVEDQRLGYLWVDPNYRSLGIGSRLIDGAVEAARASVLKRIVVALPDSAHESVTAYFRRNGFELHHFEWLNDAIWLSEQKVKPRPLMMARLIPS